MSNNNLEISAMSYVNKDFGSMYPEILRIAKQLTNEWDPANSNESDPGVVLLKEAAFVADHNNYNIDKNILENFLPSATQDISVRNITEMNGYTPRYYVSATGDISFKWIKPESEKNLSSSFVVPAFTFVVSDADETVSYTQIENLVVNDSGAVSCKFIEGTKQLLNINNSSVITLEDLDDNNRVYFPEVMVAQNGVYVRNYNSLNENELIEEDDYWVRDNYLQTRPAGSKIYKVDYDSNLDLPYIEFPSDISSIIDDGLVIEYISTSGTSGNINANTITKILSPTSFYAIGETEPRTVTDAFSVFNSGSITNGKNPETIDEMYRSFKRVVGTFDTLVSCKDYEDKIFMMTDVYDNPLVSNVYVTDRRTDFNKSINVVHYDTDIAMQTFANISIKPCSINFKGTTTFDDLKSGAPGDMYVVEDRDNAIYINMSTSSQYTNWTSLASVNNKINLNDFALLTEAMTPYDLVIYALKAFSMNDYNKYDPSYALNKSFTPVSLGTLNTIKNGLEENKCMTHTYKNPNNSDEVFIFKNYVPLNVEIEPYSKIRSNEQSGIVDNICRALSEHFNPRNLEFGKKLDIEELKSVMISADSRIKSVNINPLEYTTYAMDGQGNSLSMNDSTPYGGSSTILIDLIAKNVLEGRLCLFNFDDNFTFDYGQVGIKNKDDNYISVNKNISDLRTEAHIKITPSDNKTTVDVAGEYFNKTELKYVFEGEGDDPKDYNFNYNLYSPNPNLNSDIQVGMSYTLSPKTFKTAKGEFKERLSIWIRKDDEEVPVRKDFESDEMTTYTITNNTTEDLNVRKGDEPTNDQDVAVGTLTVSRNVTQQSFELGSQNLDSYTVKANEVIQILSPSYTSDTTYSTYVYYAYISADGTNRILANTDYTLGTGEKIVLLYSVDGESKQRILEPKTVVNANFNIYPTDLLSSNISKKEWEDENHEIQRTNFRQLTSNQAISTRKLMQTRLNSSGIWCYWLLDDNEKTLFKDNETEKILGANEYFIYTNSSLNEMMILGAGTKITKPVGSSDTWWSLNSTPTISIESISSSGTSLTDSNIPWKKDIDFSSYPMFITEMDVITLGEGDTISIYGWDNPYVHETEDETLKSIYYIDYDWRPCEATIVYKVSTSDEEVTLPKVRDFYQIRSRLDLNLSNEYPQSLFRTYDNNSNDEIIAVQRIVLNPNGSGSVTIEPDDRYELFVQSSTPVLELGGYVDVSNYNAGFYHYKRERDESGNIINYVRQIVIGKQTSSNINSGSRSFKFFFDPTCGEYLIPIHIDGEEVEIFVNANKINSDDERIPIDLEDFNADALVKDDKDRYKLKGNSSYYLNILETSPCEVELTISWDYGVTKENESITLGLISVITGSNTELKPSSITIGTETKPTRDWVLSRIRDIISGSDKPGTKFFYPYKPDNSIVLNNQNFEDANALWDINNVANNMTLPQIDLSRSNISVISSMKRD